MTMMFKLLLCKVQIRVAEFYFFAAKQAVEDAEEERK